jgi:putative membrane protein
MRNIFGIFTRDLRKISRNPIAIIILIGIIVIPSLYAWFNIVANWDPYSNTKNLKVAVGNSDLGATVDGFSINVGTKITDELKSNHDFNWIFLTKEEAIEGVKSGEYYAAIIIPTEFSKDITSILNGNIKKPKFDYYVNEKTNAIANKITDTGMRMVQENINQTFVQVITKVLAESLNISADKLSVEDPMEGLITTFNEMKVSLDNIGVSISAFKNTALALNEMVSAVHVMLPDVDVVLDDGEKTAADIQGLIDQGSRTSEQVIENITEIIVSIETISKEMNTQIDTAFTLIETNANLAADLLEATKEPAKNIIDLLDQLIPILEKLAVSFPDQAEAINALVQSLEQIVSDEDLFMEKIDEIVVSLRDTGTVSEEQKKELIDLNKKITNDMVKALTTYRDDIAPALADLMDDVYNTLGDMSQLFTATGANLSTIDQALTSTGNAMSYSVVALGDTEKLVNIGKEKIDKLINNLNAIKTDDRWGTLMNLMRIDPGTSSSFIAAPVKMETIALYPVANYGAAMTPFYTILCLWVGGLVLVAIIDTEVKHPEEFSNLRPWQAYFGRYLIFMLCGVLQALVVCLGNLFVLKVVCVEPLLFMIMGVSAGIIYSFFIYTLTVAFDEVGKAIAILLMVIQVAGAGGTYPIQVLPEFFQALYPYMAFTYGVNGMREAICGVYQNAFWVDMFKMGLYIPVALLIGLVLRKPLMTMNAYFKKRLEDTELL